MTGSIKTTAIFLRAFELPSFNEILPPGEYEVETQFSPPSAGVSPDAWKASVLVRLHPRTSHPGLSRTLTVPFAEFERAVAKDKLTGKALTDFFLEEMLADPMIRLVMEADGVGEAELRDLYSRTRKPPADPLQGQQEPITPRDGKGADDETQGIGTQGSGSL
ncbi:hypothetical protein [Paracoccus sp. SY]|uniref:hypothetical protein n=1 Tax=Paracoccus sp. SY TaxID=1330255 RepID=UPI001863E968|nr:hypothetical protein [Paracoccus sp. SY]